MSQGGNPAGRPAIKPFIRPDLMNSYQLRLWIKISVVLLSLYGIGVLID
jgi:hypothetical protein